MIKLSNFAEVNIVSKKKEIARTERPTVVLITDNVVQNGLYTSYESISEVLSAFNKDLEYANKFFNVFGGQEIYLVSTNNTTLSAILSGLKNEYIICVYTGTASTFADAINTYNQHAEMTEKKIGIIRVEEIPTSNQVRTNLYGTYDCLCVKYSTDDGAEMSVAAYLSNLKMNGIDTIKDYQFTEENLTTSDSITDEDFKYITNELHYNIDITLAKAVRNIGGDLTDGRDLTNTYTLIVLNQFLRDTLINLLATKIKNMDGVNQIRAALTEALEMFVSNGYLTTDKVWTKDSLIIKKNGIDYQIISKSTPLNKGYYVSVLPMSALTEEEKQEHKAPYCYVIIADSYGIRKISVNGEAF